jgi:cytochrome P450
MEGPRGHRLSEARRRIPPPSGSCARSNYPFPGVLMARAQRVALGGLGPHHSLRRRAVGSNKKAATFVQFDPFTDVAIADPYPRYAALRADDPVHWSDKLRAWVLFRYDDVATAFRDDARFSADRRRASRPSRSNSQPAALATLRTISSDPPECLVVRAILNAALVPRVRAIGPRIDAIVEELAAGLAGRTEVDLVADFAYALPIRVIAELLDVPEAEHARFHQLSRTIARGMDRFYGGDDVSSGLHEMVPTLSASSGSARRRRRTTCCDGCSAPSTMAIGSRSSRRSRCVRRSSLVGMRRPST